MSKAAGWGDVPLALLEVQRDARPRRRYTAAMCRFRYSALAARFAGRGIAMIALAGSIVGCASQSGPEVLTIDAAQYQQAFDAAVEAARAEGMPPAFRNPRSGVIESEPRIARSILEPWRKDNASLDQALENTLGMQRFKVRFEFTPVGFQPTRAHMGGADDAPLTGADVVGAGEPQPDLTEIHGQLELRAWVFVERAHVPGVRRNTWSRSKTDVAELVAPERASGVPSTMFWTPVARDPAFERRLLAAVDRQLQGTAEN